MTEAIRRPDQEIMVKERLLTAALELFTAKGYAATSVREIVAAAGVTKPVLYYYFGSKEGLYLELMAKPFEEFSAILAETLDGGRGAGERILILCDRLFQLLVERLAAARLMYAIYYGPPQGAPFVDLESYHLRLHEVFGELVKSGMERGELIETEVADLVWVVLGILNIALEEQLSQRPPRIGRQGLARVLELALARFSKEADRLKVER